MEKSIVSIVYCDSYEEKLVYDSIKKGIDLIGGLSSIINKDEKILIKPNLLKPLDSTKNTTTHPLVFGGVLNYLRNEGYININYGDSPAAGTYKSVKETSDICGLTVQADKFNVQLADFENYKTVNIDKGKSSKKLNICNGVLDSDAVISISKMKTHALENITGAIKNQYGCVHSNSKALGHALYPNSNSFAKMLIKLNQFVKPRLYVMDGIIAMEGNGPANGDPVLMNVILTSKDPVALDAVYAKLVALNPEYVPTCYFGEKMGLGYYNFDHIQIVTPDGEITADEAFNKFGKADFVVNRSKLKFWKLRNLLFNRKPKHRPVVDLNKCIACGVCQNACPVESKAVHSGNGKKAEYDYSKCIRCYCCQELCPAKAITREEK